LQRQPDVQASKDPLAVVADPVDPVTDPPVADALRRITRQKRNTVTVKAEQPKKPAKKKNDPTKGRNKT